MIPLTPALRFSREKMRRKSDDLFAIPVATIHLDGTVEFRGEVTGGKDSYIATIVMDQEDGARWHCECPDFRFTFHHHLKEHGEHLDDFPPYEPNGRGEPRTVHEYGMCKHVLCLVDMIQLSGVTN